MVYCKITGYSIGNGAADDYLGTPDTESNVPVESKLSMEEQKVLNEAGGKSTKDDKKKDPNATTPPEEKKKKGFFKRLFGKKDKN